MIQATIYGLVHADTIFYIGQTILKLEDRLHAHLLESKRCNTTPKHRFIVACNFEVDIMELEIVIGSIADVRERERFYIQKFKESLVNSLCMSNAERRKKFDYSTITQFPKITRAGLIKYVNGIKNLEAVKQFYKTQEGKYEFKVYKIVDKVAITRLW